jgi:hypothetical protein
MQEEYHQFQGECTKLRQQHEIRFDDAVILVLICVAGATVEGLSSTLSK